LVTELIFLKDRERELYASAREALKGIFGGDQSEGSRITGQISHMHEAWIRIVKQLRDAYRSAGVPESEWPISIGPQKTRSRNLEPDVDTLSELYTASQSEASKNISSPSKITGQWKTRWWNY
jgi:hypothetical protein